MATFPRLLFPARYAIPYLLWSLTWNLSIYLYLASTTFNPMSSSIKAVNVLVGWREVSWQVHSFLSHDLQDGGYFIVHEITLGLIFFCTQSYIICRSLSNLLEDEEKIRFLGYNGAESQRNALLKNLIRLRHGLKFDEQVISIQI